MMRRTPGSSRGPEPAAIRLVALGLLAACAPLEVRGPDVPAETAEPVVRVAVAVAADTIVVGGGGPVVVTDGEGRRQLDLPAATAALLEQRQGLVALRIGQVMVGPLPVLELHPRQAGSPVRVAGRDYRGSVTFLPDRGGVTAVNHVGIEPYLAGVVSTEMGRRAVGEEAALEAQAVASRTYALVAMGRRRAEPWDLVATVSDQAYLGVERETPAGVSAVQATRGTILTWDGRPIEAFFHSTCGGRTAAGQEVFVNGSLPYLRSIPDVSPEGMAWCAGSPRFRWREEWSGARLVEILRTTLAARGLLAPEAGDLHAVTVTGRTPSGRVSALRIAWGARTLPVTGSPAVREVLRAEPSQGLRSAIFDLEPTTAGGRLSRLVAHGQGAGHGVGMCQWGAVGRARAGQSAEQILAAYYPGTSLERRW